MNSRGFHEYSLDADPGIRLIFLPRGVFVMGSLDGDEDAWENEKPATRVTVGPCLIAKHPVTWDQYARFCEATGYDAPPAPLWSRGGDHPVVNVTWDDAVAYCEWLGLRLPTEAEWEYAARGSEGRKWPWGGVRPRAVGKWANMGAAAEPWYDDHDGWKHTSPVGIFPKGMGPFGAMDQAGNVWEWCADWYAPRLPGGEAVDPRGPDSGSNRIMRGGSWFSCDRRMRCANRNWGSPNKRHDDVGFRPCL